jgi:imidazolonepropionase-like amidohydrolase
VNAAKAGKAPGRCGGLVPGDRADLVAFYFNPAGPQIEVAAVWISGRQVYANPAIPRSEPRPRGSVPLR